jgi:hypothetical protein
MEGHNILPVVVAIQVRKELSQTIGVHATVSG